MSVKFLHCDESDGIDHFFPSSSARKQCFLASRRVEKKKTRKIVVLELKESLFVRLCAIVSKYRECRQWASSVFNQYIVHEYKWCQKWKKIAQIILLASTKVSFSKNPDFLLIRKKRMKNENKNEFGARRSEICVEPSPPEGIRTLLRLIAFISTSREKENLWHSLVLDTSCSFPKLRSFFKNSKLPKDYTASRTKWKDDIFSFFWQNSLKCEIQLRWWNDRFLRPEK